MNIFQRIVLATLLCCAMFAVGVSAATWDGTAASGFAGGTGTEADPYQIATAEQLAYLAQKVNGGTTYEGKHIKLTADIVLNDTTAENWTETARQWTPIGIHYTESPTGNNERFYGTFDGGGYTISGLYVSSSSNYMGLFGYTENATLKNVTIANASITGTDYVGALVGYMSNFYDYAYGGSFQMNDCAVISSAITGKNRVGGLVGSFSIWSEDDTVNYSVKNCSVTNSSVSGNNKTGGLIGAAGATAWSYNDKVYIKFESCENNNSTVTGTDSNVGGIVGYGLSTYNSSDGSAVYITVTDCTNSGNVSASSDYAGGIAGYGSTFTDCTNSGNVSASSDYAGGIAGYGSTFTDCTNSANVSASDGYAGGIAGNGTTFTNCTNSGAVSGYKAGGIAAYFFSAAKFENCVNTGNISSLTYTSALGFAGGTGTQSDPYQIATAEQLVFLAQTVNSGKSYSGYCIKLTADITLNDTASANWTSTAKQWTPIGTSSYPFKGTFDGGGHTISGLYIASSSNNQGLFGYTSGSNLENVTIANADITGASCVGALVGYAYYEAISYSYDLTPLVGCTVKDAKIVGTSSVGGLIGQVHGYTERSKSLKLSFTDCTSESSIITGSSGYAGGILGYCNCSFVSGTTLIFNVTVTSCFNASDVSGSSCAGGIAGYCQNASFAECINTGTISVNASTGTSGAGGIVGGGTIDGVFISCINSGDISSYSSGNASYAGGIASYGNIFISCSNLGNVSSSNSDIEISYAYAGGIAARCNSSLTSCNNFGEVSAFTTYYSVTYYEYARAGGIAGDNNFSTLEISNCFNAGSSTGGGIIGNITEGVMTCCYSRGTSKGKGIADSAGENTVIISCFYLTGASKEDGNAIALTNEQMKQPTSFVGFDFSETWGMGDASYPYPVLRSSVYVGTTNAVTPILFAQTNSLSCEVNGDAALFVSASVTDGGVLTYQWYVSDTADGEGVAIPDAVSAGYKPDTSSAGVRYYYVVVTNTNSLATGEKTASARSSVMAVTVGGAPLYTITGSLYTGESADTVTIELLDGEKVVASVVVASDAGTANYSIPAVPHGTYTLRMTKAGHSPYQSTVTVENDTVLPQVQLYLLGDANHDGKADSSDAVAILRNLAGYEVPDFYEDTADFNGDGKADSSDAVAILRKLAGY